LKLIIYYKFIIGKACIKNKMSISYSF